MTTKKIIQTFKDDWKEITLCILAAIIIYIICQVAFLEKKSFAVPLKVQNNSNFVCVNDIPRFVRVTVRGEPTEIGLLQEKDFDVFIDLSEYVEAGKYKAPLHLQLSENATTVEELEVQLNTSSIDIELEPNVTTLIPIKPNIVGACAKGYEVSSVEIYPDLVQITGSESLVAKTQFLETSVVDINGKSSDFTKKVEAINKNSRVVISGQKEFSVTVKIKPIKATKKIESSVIFFYGLPEGLSIENPRVPYTIVLSGTKNELDKFVLSPLAVQVDCSSITTSGTYDLPLSVILPDGIVLDKIEPAMIKVTVVDFIEIPLPENLNNPNEEDKSTTENNNSLPITE